MVRDSIVTAACNKAVVLMLDHPIHIMQREGVLDALQSRLARLELRDADSDTPAAVIARI